MTRPLPLLISCRPALCRPGQLPALEWALETTFRERTGIDEWRWPAFALSVENVAVEAISRWLAAVGGDGSREGACGDSPAAGLIVLVSPGSLELLRPLLPDPWPVWLKLGLMGDGSAARARALGVPESHLIYPRQSLGQSQDSAALLALLAGFPPMPALLLKGNGGNQALAPSLQAVSETLTVLQAYRREPFPVHPSQLRLLDQLDSAQTVVWYVTSSEAATRLAPLICRRPAAQAHVWVTHPKIETAARDAGMVHVRCIAPGQATLQAHLMREWGDVLQG